VTGAFLALLAGALALLLHAAVGQGPTAVQPPRPHDAIDEAQAPREVPEERPEQKKSAHDRSDVFAPDKALPTTRALAEQAGQGRFLGFDLYKDPVGALKPGMTFEEVYKGLSDEKPKVMATQRKLLEARYNLEPRLDPVARMSRGKPLVVGPAAR